MAARSLQEVIRHMRRTVGGGEFDRATDSRLLEHFASQGDQDAFELLLWRHAGTVLGVCRRVLRDEQAAEDAFQATFLVLARKAGSIGRGESVGGWLHRTACRIALRSRAGAVRRASRERRLDELDLPAGKLGLCDEAAWQEMREALDEEVGRLPAKYREAFVLRCLAGKSAAEAAGELGCPAATVESRLGRARQRLRTALARRGFATMALSDAVALGVVSEVATAALAAARRAAVGGCVSPKAVALAGEVMRTMTMTRLKVAVLLLALISASGVGGVALLPAGAQTQPGERQARDNKESDKADKDKPNKQKAQILRLQEEVKDLRLRLDKMQLKAEVAEINFLLLRREREDLRAELKRRRREIDGVLTKVDIAGNRVSLTLGETKLALDGVTMSASVKFSLDGKECTINDLKPGMAVSLRIAPEEGKSVATVVNARKPKKE